MRETDWVWDFARPMLALAGATDLATLVKDGHYVLDEKIDGVRALAAVGADGFRLVNRNHVDRTDRYPDLMQQHSQMPSCVLDGEIVCLDDSLGFEGIARRDKQQSPSAILTAAQKTPAKFVAFDMLMHQGRDLRGLPWYTRRAILEGRVEPLMPSNFTVSRTSTRADFYEEIVAAGGEGVVAKRSSSTYVMGRSGAWFKHKAKFRLTAIVVGYEPGTGKRRDCGKFLLSLLDEQCQPVPLGKVGSGFTDVQLAEYKTRLDGGRMWLAEIETMGLTDSGALRQPIFKGERTDLSFLDANTSQLKTLPKGTTAP